MSICYKSVAHSVRQTKPENIYISKCFHWLVVTVWRLLDLGVSVCLVACDEMWRAEHCQQQSERWRPVTPAPVVTQVSWCHGVTRRSVTQTVTRNEPTFPIRDNLRLGSHYRDRILIARWSCPQWGGVSECGNWIRRYFDKIWARNLVLRFSLERPPHATRWEIEADTKWG